MLTIPQARKAIETTADVITEEGDACVIARLHVFKTNHAAREVGLPRRGMAAEVAGQHVYGWVLLTELSPSSALLELPDRI